MATVYERLGVRRVINALGHRTRLGGSVQGVAVRAAMDAAAQSCVDVFELKAAVETRLAKLTRNEDVCVCNGAAAGLFLSVLACMDGTARSEIVIHRMHRVPPDVGIALSGATIVEIGTEDGASIEDLQGALHDRTAAVVYMAGGECGNAIPLAATIAIAHEHVIPVIVDAAAELPPADNLWRFTAIMHADAAVFSGGKDLGGPQSSGLIVGHSGLIAKCRRIAFPNDAPGRPMKVGKEEMVGLLTAVEAYLGRDFAERAAICAETVRCWRRELEKLPGVFVEWCRPDVPHQPSLFVDVALTGEKAIQIAPLIVQELWDCDPRIAIALGPDGCSLRLTPFTLAESEAAQVHKALFRCLQKYVQPGTAGI